ncbi:FUSC family protein [Blautia hydrogenotrophica]|uniref:FUSC family protein n=1 Tax=Blautia hydrogenotrophica TaxID=53443 RepID=UPI003AB1E3A4
MQKLNYPAVCTYIRGIKKKFLKALPVIIFFLALFYSVIGLFGIQHVMIVSLVTVLFQVTYQKQPTVPSLFAMMFQQILLEILAFFATLNLPLCLALNLVVPFWLIFSKASQFNQLGYFSSLMTFTFLQLMPVGWSGFFQQMEAMLYSLFFFFIIVCAYSQKRGVIPEDHTEQHGLQLLADVLEKTARGEDTEAETAQLFQIQKSLYKDAYQKRGRKHIVTAQGKVRYMFALLFHRCVYFVSGQYKSFLPENETAKALALQLSAYMKEAGDIDFWNQDTEELKKKGKKLLLKTRQQKEEFYHSATNFLRMFLLILDQIHLDEDQILDENWKVPLKQRLKERFLYRMKLDAFEMRFALRMSIILLVGMSYNILVDADHGYWLAMNAFLLLRPMYEDSKYRMKTRFVGTAAGCILMMFILSFCHSTLDHFIVASIMVACMYTATPGTRIHAVFVTCFALSMTTMAMQETLALELRMIYVAVAVLLVLLVNQFFFPTSLGTQFRYNWKMIFHMHHMYLRFLENTLTNSLDYWRVCDAQIQYHMVYDQIEQYLPKVVQEEQPYYRRILRLCWRMLSEMEQMLFLSNRKKWQPQTRQNMMQYICYTDYVLNSIQEMLHLQKEKRIKSIEGMKYQRYIEGEKNLSILMTQYAKNLSKLYVIVSRKYQS